MVGLDFLLGAFGLGEEQEKQEEGGGAQADQTSSSQRKQSARGIAIGIAIHDIPEALPIGAVLAVSPVLSLLIALVLAVEELAESNAIAAELSQSKVSNAYLFWQTCWPSLFGVIGAPLGVLLAGISPLVLAFALSGAAGIMLFISGEIWGDSREDAGVAFSSIGMLAGVLLALFTSSIGPT
jgi:ZIP family zinc transporter